MKVYVLELLHNRKWKPIASSIVKAKLEGHKREVLSKHLWTKDELRIRVYTPAGTGVER